MYENVITFIKGIFDTDDFIPLHEPRFIGNERNYTLDAIDSTFVSSVGNYVNRFEADFAIITESKYTIATVNGTSALHVAMKLVGVESSTEVLTQPLTFVATGNAISYLGAMPHFIDVDKCTLGMCPIALEKRLEEIAIVNDSTCYNKNTGKRITACVPMHTFGFPCEIDRIVSICKKYYIPVVEDAAEALGSYYKGKHLGTFGDIGVFSFNGNKIITSGGGGAIITNNSKYAQRAKHITTTAKIPHAWDYEHDEVGYNYRMPNLNAALLVAQLEQLDFFLKNKRELASVYIDFFKNSNIIFINEPPNSKSNYWLMAILLDTKKEKENFLRISNQANIMTRPVWKLLHLLPMFCDAPYGDLSNAIWLSERVVNIPSSVRI